MKPSDRDDHRAKEGNGSRVTFVRKMEPKLNIIESHGGDAVDNASPGSRLLIDGDGLFRGFDPHSLRQ